MSAPKKIAMLQPNYIPWKGVFDLINQVDIFVFYDDVQYTVKDWRNRNIIKTPQGTKWLSVPVIHKGKRNQLICEAEIDTSTNWQDVHFKTIRNSYLKAPYYKNYEYILEAIYLSNTWTHISDLDIFSTKLIAKALDINTEWVKASDLKISGQKDGEKIINICKHLNCNYFINGPSAKAFMNDELFKKEHITLDYIIYEYPEYKQLYPPFTHFVSVIDVIFNCGEKDNL